MQTPTGFSFLALLFRTNPPVILHLLVVLLMGCGLSARGESPKPDPLALLRGVETARSALSSGRFEYRVTLKGTAPNLRGGKVSHLVVEFSGGKWKYEQRSRDVVIDEPNADGKLKQLQAMNFDREAFVRAGLGQWEEGTVRKIYDGSAVLGSSSPKSAGISGANPQMSTGNSFFFDPRTLGLGLFGHMSESLDACLDYRKSRNVGCLGSEQVDGEKAWHVVITNVYAEGQEPVEKHFWIGDQEGFPVYRYEQRQKGQAINAISAEYRKPVSSNRLPSRVRKQMGLKAGEPPRIETEIEELKAEYGVDIPPASFTLAGLQLAVGASVQDNRLSRVVGYWNGTDLSPDHREAIRRGRQQAAPQEPSLAWAWALSAGAGLIILVLAGFLVRRRLIRPTPL